MEADNRKLIYLPEPLLLFRHGQAMEDPRDGLTLFGPLDIASPLGVRAGVVGTEDGIAAFKRWVAALHHPVRTKAPTASRPPFSGFESVFRIPWTDQPLQQAVISPDELKRRLYQDDRHQRVYQTVELFAEGILKVHREEEAKPDIWFVVIPDDVRKYCRPQSFVEPALRHEARREFATSLKDNVRYAKNLQTNPSLFAEQNEAAEPYAYKEHFRNQLKARLLIDRIATQVVRESTLNNVGNRGSSAKERAEEHLQSQIAWNMSTTAFYKLGGRPWKVAGIREGVAYIGLVFKRNLSSGKGNAAACGAQMFLDSGDGLVFKGADGQWFDSETDEFHLTREAAKDLIAKAIESYKAKHNGQAPAELFIHGQTRFNRLEYGGFCDAVSAESTRVVAIRIRDESSFKLFTRQNTPVLRGTAYIADQNHAFLWTKGWTPRLRTYPGMEVPNPLSVEICHGEAKIEEVLKDVLALTKLNYNTCRFGDGKPITLKFADAIGEVLVTRPVKDAPPLPFMYYI
jgi:AmiR/NasT family two-component response regulator